jgi:hypothetical protein
MPYSSVAPVVIMAVYDIVAERALDGVKVAVALDGS